ncbi:MAG: signal recognition particle-docking protein FtsY [Candidatus Krumholzibacteria bacterium]|jgi:fused signal recognition particle receptor|nr:signal recognition particle-docking protein FtsY [Candidatus Krumholzibacteria bacterium]
MLEFVKGLRRTKEQLLEPLQGLFSSGKLGEEEVEELEAILYSADIGVEATGRIVERVRERARKGDGRGQDYLSLVSAELLSILDEAPPYSRPAGRPRVIVVVGVNGVGKTSTIGKLAARLKSEGETVMLAACDTFRAAAIDQLELWAGRSGVAVVRQKMGSDPAAVAFDAVSSAKARGIGTVIVDTAGRLHTRVNLMEELLKIFRVLSSRIEGAGLEAWLVLDANSGQNSLRQAEVFVRALPVTGIVLAKLDSTARGGIVIPVQKELGVPVLYAGTGEGIDDLEPFDHKAFVRALLA